MKRDCNMRRELRIGLLVYGLSLAADCLWGVPEGVKGFLIGLAICMEFIGILPEQVYQGLKEKKRAIFRGLRAH